MRQFKNQLPAQSPDAKKREQIFRHPYLSFILLGVILILILLMQTNGFLDIASFRAIGVTLTYFVAALGFTLLLGYSGLNSLGTAGFIGLGSYLAGLLIAKPGYDNFGELIAYGLDIEPIIGLMIGILVAIVIGGVVGFISLRIEGLYLAIVTLGLSEIFVEIFRNLGKFTGGVDGRIVNRGSYHSLLGVFPVTREVAFIILAVVIVVAMIFVVYLIKSPTGRAMLALKNSSSAAQAMGVSMLKYRLTAFVLATVFAVVAGYMYMLFYQSSYADIWTLSLSLNILAAVVVGGAFNVWGVLAGTFLIFGFDLAILQIIQFFQQNSNASIIFSGALIILVVMFYPGGISQMLVNIKNWYNERRSKKSTRKDAYARDSELKQKQEKFISEQAAKIGR